MSKRRKSSAEVLSDRFKRDGIEYREQELLLPGVGMRKVFEVRNRDILGLLRLWAGNARNYEAWEEINLTPRNDQQQKIYEEILSNDRKFDALRCDILACGENHTPIHAVLSYNDALDWLELIVGEGNRRVCAFKSIFDVSEEWKNVHSVFCQIWIPESAAETNKMLWSLELRSHSNAAAPEDHNPVQRMFGCLRAIREDGGFENRIQQVMSDPWNYDKEEFENLKREVRIHFPGLSPLVVDSALRIAPIYESQILPHLRKRANDYGCPLKHLMRKCGGNWIVKLLSNASLKEVLIGDKYLPLEECVDLVIGTPIQRPNGKWGFSGQKIQTNDFIPNADLDLLIKRAAGDPEKIQAVVGTLKADGVPGLKRLNWEWNQKFATVTPVQPTVSAAVNNIDADIDLSERIAEMFTRLEKGDQKEVLDALNQVYYQAA